VTRTFFFTTAALLAVALAASCSDDTSPSGTATGSGTGTGTGQGNGGEGGDPTPEDSCIRPGDMGNDVGVGEYCTPGGGECDDFAEAPFCLADVGQDQWFCTRIGCDEETNCGEGAGCLMVEGSGSACVPCRCEDGGIGCDGSGGSGGSGGAGGAGG
jgi:hypothetical protein